MAKRRVVVTGASGYVVQRMWEALGEHYEVVALDARTATREDRAWGAVAAEAMVATGGSCSLVDDECSTRFPTR